MAPVPFAATFSERVQRVYEDARVCKDGRRRQSHSGTLAVVILQSDMGLREEKF